MSKWNRQRDDANPVFVEFFQKLPDQITLRAWKFRETLQDPWPFAFLFTGSCNRARGWDHVFCKRASAWDSRLEFQASWFGRTLFPGGFDHVMTSMGGI